MVESILTNFAGWIIVALCLGWLLHKRRQAGSHPAILTQVLEGLLLAIGIVGSIVVLLFYI